MPDISMCSNDKCPLKLKCYRFMAIPGHWQSYMGYDNKKHNCYDPIKPGDNVRKIEETTGG